jgi:hypothetical protein
MAFSGMAPCFFGNVPHFPSRTLGRQRYRLARSDVIECASVTQVPNRLKCGPGRFKFMSGAVISRLLWFLFCPPLSRLNAVRAMGRLSRNASISRPLSRRRRPIA